MMELTPELIIKHRKLIEARVKQHTRRNKSGKTFTVKQFERIGQTKAIGPVMQSHHAFQAANKKLGPNHPITNKLRSKMYAARDGFISGNRKPFGGLSGPWDTKPKIRKRKQHFRAMDDIKAHHKKLGPDPMLPGQLKKKYGKNIFSGGRKRKK